MTNNDNQRYFPLRDPENPFKVALTPITEEQYRALYPDIWATQKREQYHGRCMCTKRYLWKCDGQCDLCEYHAPDTTSLDEPLPDGNGTLGDYIPDSRPSIEDIIADRDLLFLSHRIFHDCWRHFRDAPGSVLTYQGVYGKHSGIFVYETLWAESDIQRETIVRPCRGMCNRNFLCDGVFFHDDAVSPRISHRRIFAGGWLLCPSYSLFCTDGDNGGSIPAQ